MTDVEINSGVWVGRRDYAGHIAIRDQGHARANRAQALNDAFMTRAVQHTSGHVGDIHALVLGQRLNVLGRCRIQTDNAFRIARAYSNLVHIGVWRIQQAATRRDGQHGQRIGHGFCG